jgi:hypothetical protein
LISTSLALGAQIGGLLKSTLEHGGGERGWDDRRVPRRQLLRPE